MKPATIPIRIDADEAIPLPLILKNKATIKTVKATVKWFALAKISGLLFINHPPPPAYMKPTLSKLNPIISTTIPVTNGGKRCLIGFKTFPMKNWKIPPMNAAVNTAPSPAALKGSMIGINAKLVPWIIGSLAPISLYPIVWIIVATPATNRAIWIKNIFCSGVWPKTPATIIGTVMFPANIASTCWIPKGIDLFNGSFLSGLLVEPFCIFFEAISPPH